MINKIFNNNNSSNNISNNTNKIIKMSSMIDAGNISAMIKVIDFTINEYICDLLPC